jgi:carboxymethylenebutenolidase
MSDHSKILSRRQFVGAGIGVGFALAVRPTSAWAVLTSDEGLVSGAVKIPTLEGEMPAYRAMPKGAEPFPVVLVIQEIFGVHEYIQDVCRRLAKQGYLAVAPSLYFRHGDVTQMKDIKKIVSDVVSKVEQPKVMADLDSTVEWVGKNSGDTNRMGITGFCWGGRVTWLYTAHNPKIKAAVAWYGPLVGSPSSTQTPNPIDIAAELKTPVLGLYGGKDDHIAQTDIEKMRTILKSGKSGSEIDVYPDAEHGFHADYRPSYNEKDAKDGWFKLLAWFAKNGVK